MHKNILIAPIRLDTCHYLEYMYGAFASARGANVYAIIDVDMVLHNKDFSIKSYTALDYFKSKLIILICKIARIQIINVERCSITYNYENQQISKNVESTLRRFKYQNKITESETPLFEYKIEKDVINIYGSLRKSAIKFDYGFISHGIYSMWGPVFDYLKISECDCIVYGSVPYYGRAFLLTKGPMQTNTPIGSSNTISRDSRLEAGALLDSRVVLSSPDQSTFVKVADDRIIWNELLDKVRPYKKAIGIFPNCLWDGNIPERDSIFDDLIHCINQTIESVEETTIVIIRLHPAEATLWSEYVSIKDSIIKKSNVLILDAELGINSHKLAKICDLNVVYDGILALEFAYSGSTVVVPSDSYYKKIPGVIKVDSYSHYQKLLREFSFPKEPQVSKEIIIDWLVCNILNARHTFHGYVPDGERIKFGLLKACFQTDAFLKIEKSIKSIDRF